MYRITLFFFFFVCLYTVDIYLNVSSMAERLALHSQRDAKTVRTVMGIHQKQKKRKSARQSNKTFQWHSVLGAHRHTRALNNITVTYPTQPKSVCMTFRPAELSFTFTCSSSHLATPRRIPRHSTLFTVHEKLLI